MLACELDLPIGIDVPLTLLSAALAVLITFAALASDFLWRTYERRKRRRNRVLARQDSTDGLMKRAIEGSSSNPRSGRFEEEELDCVDNANDPELPLLSLEEEPDEEGYDALADDLEDGFGPTPALSQTSTKINSTNGRSAMSPDGSPTITKPFVTPAEPQYRDSCRQIEERPGIYRRRSSQHSVSQRSDSLMGSNVSTYGGLGHIMNMAYRSTAPAKNAFIATAQTLRTGCTIKNIIKGFLWSLAITSMHYVGIAALLVPKGYYTLNLPLVVLSAMISWVVCLVGCILMSEIETHFAQQLLFAGVACIGVAAMHFTGMLHAIFHSILLTQETTGMWAVSFWTYAEPSTRRGYPSALAVAIVSISIVTCLAANFLLAHVATLSRNKLAEIVMTRKELWKTIAMKENAEAAAAAKSDFIASASHEIRTPLHHLQGYSDLLSRTELTEEGRTLLYAIQHATKTLSLSRNLFYYQFETY